MKIDVFLAAIMASTASVAASDAVPIRNSGTTVRLDWTDSLLPATNSAVKFLLRYILVIFAHYAIYY